MTPYKIVTLGHGRARIVDRATNTKIGEVLLTNLGNWQGFLDGEYRPVTTTTLRAAAAAKVWECRTGPQ